MAGSDQTVRTPVSRARALTSAVELADRDGLSAVSMRNLAGRLGVVPMALYKHVADKDDLLGGMLDVVIARYDPPTPGGPWKRVVRRRILSARRVLLEHPWARQLIESRTTRTPQVLAYLDSLTGVLLAGGLSPDLTHHAMHALGHRIWGFSPEAFDDPEALRVPADPAEQAAMLTAVRETYPAIATVALAAVDGDLSALGTGCDEQYEFEFTLDLLLDAFERLHASGWSSAR